MNKNKKFIIITLLILSLGLILFFLFKKDKTESEKQIVPAKPSIPKKYSGELNYKINISEKDFISVEKLPLIELVNKQISVENIKQIAKKMGFLGDPDVTEDVFDGTAYIWKDETSILFCFPNSGLIRLSTNKEIKTDTTKLTDEELSSIAENYFYNNSFTEMNSLKIKEVIYLKPDINTEKFKEVNRDEAEIFEIVFNPKFLDYEINTYWTDQPLISIKLLTDGSIFSLQFKNLSQSQNTQTTYNIKDFQEFKNTISESSLISVKNVELALSDLVKESIAEIEINKVELIYLQESSKSIYLQPIFKIFGTTSISGIGNGVEVVLYLPAISQK